MRAIIKHDIPGRIRVHFIANERKNHYATDKAVHTAEKDRSRFSFREADTLQYYLQSFPCIKKATVYERTADAVIRYTGNRDEIINIISKYSPEKTDVPESFYESSSREMNAKYYESIVTSVVWHYAKKMFLPAPARTVLTVLRSVNYIWRGLKTIPERKLKVEQLDAIAITASVLVKDHSTALPWAQTICTG